MKKEAMREPTFLVLAALAAGPRHGYAVMREVSEISEGRVQLRAGTLYSALERLTTEGLVAEAGQEVVEGRLRRYYSLTDAGAESLRIEVARMQAGAHAASQRLQGRAAAT